MAAAGIILAIVAMVGVMTIQQNNNNIPEPIQAHSKAARVLTESDAKVHNFSPESAAEAPLSTPDEPCNSLEANL